MIKGAVGAKAYEKAEDPIYVLDNNIPLDTEWYLEHQLSEPLKRLFDPILDNTNSLLEGDHTRKIKKAMPSTSGLMKFVSVTQRCLGCKGAVSAGSGVNGGTALCVNCKSREAEVYLMKQQQLLRCEEFFWRTSIECQRITGCSYKDVLGIARDSPIYYQMKKALKDVNEARETIARFQDAMAL